MKKSVEIISSCQQAVLHLRPFMSFDVEEVWILALACNARLIKKQCLFRGTVDECSVHPREILRFAIVNRASQMIMAHSHPSGECFPSEADLHFTVRLRGACDLMQIPLLDHLILTHQFHFSFAERLWSRGL